jgi:hypothetical protein
LGNAVKQTVGHEEMKTIRNICLAVLAYFIAALISGQILMHGQGDTPEISFRYGLLYAVVGGGIRDMFRYFRLGEFHFSAIFAALIQLLMAVGVFCGLQFRNRKSTGVANNALERDS